MANETSYATLLSNGGRVARYLNDTLHENLYDRTSLRGLMRYIDLDGMMGSATTNVTKVSSPGAAAAASSEVSGGQPNTPLSTGNYDLTVARYVLQMAPTDLMGIVTGGPVDVDYIVRKLVEAVDLTLTDLLCAAFPNLSTSIGTSGVDLSVDNWFDAFYALNLALNPASGLASVLHQQQVNDLIESTRAETGALQFRTDTQGLLTAPGVGFAGQFLGVQIYQADSVSSSGGNRRGGMFSGGCFSYTLGSVAKAQAGQLINPADLLVATPELFVERDRDSANGITKLLLNFYPAVAEAEDARGVLISTDA